MNKKELVAVGFGDVPAWLADEGLEIAINYFENNNLNPQLCFEARNNELAYHWDKAENLANNVLLSNTLYDNSMISLEFDD